MEQLLHVEALTIGREGAPLLSGVAFSLGQGQGLILQGPNGAGKTTLLRTLAGFIPPIAGRIQSDEPAFAGHLDGIKAQLTVRENLGFWAEVHGGGAIEPALEAFDLTALAARPARALSAGQKRRLGLARLMLTGRRLWLLDEPTVSLDKASVRRFADVVRAHLAGGGAALIATHTDLGLAAPVLDVAPFRTASAARADRSAKTGPGSAGGAPPQAGAPATTTKQDPFGAGW